MLFKYPLTDSQYDRFQHDTNDAEIKQICTKAGVEVTDEKIVGGIETWYFRGRCSGTMALIPCDQHGDNMVNFVRHADRKPHHWECWIQVRSKPWWLPWFVLDWGFREALK